MYTVSQKSDVKIQITITIAHLIRIKYYLTSFNYHLSNVNVANFNKIDCTVYKQQLFLKMELKNRSFQYGKYRFAYLLHEVLRASPVYSVHFLKISHGLGHRVNTWDYRTDVH